MSQGKVYQCSMCKEVYEAEWTEEEARAEQHELFPGIPDDFCDIVCDYCFKKLMGETRLSAGKERHEQGELS